MEYLPAVVVFVAATVYLLIAARLYGKSADANAEAGVLLRESGDLHDRAGILLADVGDLLGRSKRIASDQVEITVAAGSADLVDAVKRGLQRREQIDRLTAT